MEERKPSLSEVDRRAPGADGQRSWGSSPGGLHIQHTPERMMKKQLLAREHAGVAELFLHQPWVGFVE